ncbi:MAG: DUF6452 family protein [Bacteroidales bacterium]|nr:DUF6452 family protein [Bacteroidales bacterium]
MNKAIAMMAIAAAMTLSACSGDGCTDNSSSIPLAGFFKSGKAVSLSDISLRGLGAPGDSLLLKQQTVTEVYLPLRPKASNCQFEIDYNLDGGDLRDTISIDYSSTPAFASVDCGAMLNFEIKGFGYTRHAIDSITLVRPVVTNENAVTFKIHMR